MSDLKFNLYHEVPVHLICTKHLKQIFQTINLVLDALRKDGTMLIFKDEYAVIPNLLDKRYVDVHTELMQRHHVLKTIYTYTEIEDLAGTQRANLHRTHSDLTMYNAFQLFGKCELCRKRLYNELHTETQKSMLKMMVSSLKNELKDKSSGQLKLNT